MELFKDLNLKTFEMLKKFLGDKNLLTNFLKCKNFDEYYDFCIKIVHGYSKSEIKYFFNDIKLLTNIYQNDKILLIKNLERFK